MWYKRSLIILIIVKLLVFPAIIFSATDETLYYKGDECYKNIIKSGKTKYRENWQSCIESFKEAYRQNPKGRYAAASLYMIGKIYRELYTVTQKGTDKQEAIHYFQRVITEFKRSNYIPLAKRALVEISSLTDDRENRRKDTGGAISKKNEPVKNSTSSYDTSTTISQSLPKNQITTISALRFWSNPNYTRIVVDADNETTFSHHILNEDPSINKPQRLFIDFDNSRLGASLDKPIPIDDNLLSNVRAGQYTPDKVRVVVDIKSFQNYKIFSLRNPFRLILDVWGKDVLAKTDVPAPQEKIEPIEPQSPPEKEPSVNRLAKQLALGVKKIVIDPGHGGHDPGAVGYSRDVLEKDIVLSISKKLERKLRSQLGVEVIMTRNTDRYLSLEERTAIANTKNADLFISIHTNASPDRNAYGIETYFLNLATDDDAIRVAARENATTRKNISDLQAILNDLMKNAKINESSRLAAHVQKSMHTHLNRRYSQVVNKGVKQAPFYVLLGAQMPSILIETSFISNKRECERLNDSVYQEYISDAIVDGIRNYIREINPTALYRDNPENSG